MPRMDDDPIEFFATGEEWEQWLADNHESAPGVWVKIAKKEAAIASVHYPEVLDTAIAYGWIDHIRRKLDDTHFLQRFAPRGPRSKWSKINREKAEEMMRSGTMKPAGLREVEKAKADGRWAAAYDGQRTMQVPPDLQAELDSDPAMKEFFEGLSSQNRYAFLYRLHDAKKPETRARRLERFVEMLKRRETFY